MVLAQGRGPVPLGYFEAVTRTPEQAAELAYQVNTARREQEALARMRSGGRGFQ